MIQYAYAASGLKYNPFGELERQQRMDQAFPRCDLASVVRFLGDDSLNRRAVQFLGPCGSGKTTHLLALAGMLPAFHYCHLPPATRRYLPDLPHLMIDEAQRLGFWQRRRHFRQCQQLVLATHRCLAASLRRHGFAVLTLDLQHTPATEWLLKTWRQKLADAQRVPTGAQSNRPGNIKGPAASWLSADLVNQLRADFGSNIRGMERRLYEIVYSWNQAIPGSGDRGGDESM
jgi:hypothetical protein